MATWSGSSNETLSASSAPPAFVAVAPSGDVNPRFRIDGEIARGGMGVVYRAYDRVMERFVALKRPREVTVEHRERARREALALRLLRVPGVVQLVDEGEDEHGRYIVTDYIEGTPFPGAGGVAALAGLAAQLLEVLARVHAAGILHRDLKPQNVLVDAEGRIHVLDFGIARGAPLGPALTASDALIGTPRYLAPEQIGGAPTDARTDLYAVGLMLYEALAGGGPFADSPGEAAVYARVWRDPPPVTSRAPEVRPKLAQLVDRLVARLPERRPASAAEALTLLGRDLPLPRLRMVGRDAELAALVTAAREVRALGVFAEPGFGRTRLLEEASAALRAEGRDVVWLLAGERPLASIRASFELGPDLDPEACRAAVQARLDNGAVLVVDAAERVDRWSVALLARLNGALLGVGEGIVLRPLTEEQQRDLFWGPDKVLHLREDGARELHRRAWGIPARALAVLTDWVDAGLARFDGERVRLDPGAALQLADLPVRAPILHMGQLPEEASLRALLPWIVLGDGEIGRATLERVSGRPGWEIGLLLEELVEAGLVVTDHRGCVLPRAGAEAALVLWSDTERRAGHRALGAALPTGTRARLRHLVQGGEVEEVAAEARAVARALAAAGRFGVACHVLDTAAAVVRWQVPPQVERGLLRDYVLLAFPAEDIKFRELAAQAVRRADCVRLGTEVLQDLADAGIALARRHFSVAEGLIADLPEQEDEDVELVRVTMLVSARIGARPAEADRELDGWAGWASKQPERRGRWEGWRGLAAYRHGRFAEAAALQRKALALRADRYGGLVATINLATSLLDAGELSAASEVARSCLVVAAEARLPSFELRGYWVLRSALVRGGVAGVDPELIEAATLAEYAHTELPLLLNEAVGAWRAGDVELAAACCEQVVRRAPDGVAGLLSRGLLVELGRADAKLFGVEVARLPVGRLRAQLSALCRRPDPEWIERCAAEDLASPHGGEVLSGREIVDRLLGCALEGRVE